ncbi:MAG TPA: TIGR03621 family F420-dependent LLM class oxidoreductase [Acidimicrobiales bacterium]|jgi:probable F420-dependent oxidoreductase|nr:TIGR03621 family F420-dependent LLM class oxidoreductase [Acidimicrobiales bacterium]
MPHPRRFRFGVQVSSAPDGAAWTALAQRVEQLGYSSLYVPDHFGDQLGPIAALTAAAAATTNLRVGSLVLDNDYRHPVVMAKEAASIDVLSGGRLELGIGAGWMTTDYDQSGIPKDPAGVRVDRMVEAIAVLKAHFGDGLVEFQGEHYQVSGLDGQPKPVQQPLPLLIGGGGPRVLEIAGREASIVGINPNLRTGKIDAETASDAVASKVDAKLEHVRRGAGDRFDDLELQILVFGVIITDDRKATMDAMASSFGIAAGDDFETPYFWIGSQEEIVADLQRWRDRWGTSYWVVQGEAAAETAAPIVAALNGT